MPSIGSFVIAQVVEIAPTSLPSTNTGLPLIPCATPISSIRFPTARAKIKSCFGPMPRMTERISTVNVSISVPEKTVRAVAIVPGTRSFEGRICGLAWLEACANPAPNGARQEHSEDEDLKLADQIRFSGGVIGASGGRP